MRVQTLILFALVSFCKGQGNNGILASLRNIVSGVTTGLNFDFLDDFGVPDSMVPDEFKVIRHGMCQDGQPTLSCSCETGAEMDVMTFPTDRFDITFRDLKTIFSKCRPT